MNNFHPSNILASPATSLLGAGWLLNMVGNQLTTEGVPTTPAGWVGLGANVLVGVAALLGKG